MKQHLINLIVITFKILISICLAVVTIFINLAFRNEEEDESSRAIGDEQWRYDEATLNDEDADIRSLS